MTSALELDWDRTVETRQWTSRCAGGLLGRVALRAAGTCLPENPSAHGPRPGGSVCTRHVSCASDGDSWLQQPPRRWWGHCPWQLRSLALSQLGHPFVLSQRGLKDLTLGLPAALALPEHGPAAWGCAVSSLG